MWDVQSGFMPEKSSVDQNFVLHVVFEKYLFVGKKVFEAFVNLGKTYDQINRAFH